MVRDTKVLLDLSSVLGAFLHLEDKEFGKDINYRGKEFHIPDVETSMERFKFSVENFEADTTDFIVVKDPGGLPRARTSILPSYKQKPRIAPPEFFEAREALFEAATTWLKSMGAIIATPKNHTEADDLINQLAIRLPSTVIWTRDKDLLACPTNVFLQGANGVEINPTDRFPVEKEFIHLYRAIVTGDDSDNVKSCKGFGPVAWQKMVDKYGEEAISDLDYLLQNRMLGELERLADEFPPFKLVLEQAKDLYTSYRVLQFQPVPAHKVKWEGGMLVGKKTLVTKKNFSKVLEHLLTLKFDYSVIDYEGDVCEESRNWSELSDVSVDVLAQEITGMGLRINSTNWYFCTNHADTENISLQQLEEVLEILWGKPILAHNAQFENILTYNHFGTLLPNMVDTMLEASYVDENNSLALKSLSKTWLDYDQTTYSEVLGEAKGMSEISGERVMHYGIDDVITTDALQNLFYCILNYEGTYDLCNKVENDALYFSTLAFIEGVEFDWDAYKALKVENDKNTKEAWDKLNTALLNLGWIGGEFRPMKGFNMGEVNRVYSAVHGHPLTGVSSVKEAIKVMEDRGFAKMLENKELSKLNLLFEEHWKPEAEFNVRSPKQMSTLLYDVLKLPVRLRNPPTANMRKKGLPGNPAANEDAINNAIAYNDTEETELLNLLLDYKGCLTKESLFLEKYPKFIHWKTGKLHAALRQSATSTRRFSCSKPNLQQLPKRKGKEYRNMLKSKKGYSFVALDFTGQELRLAADDSRDPAFMACYVGENKKNPHVLTGQSIAEENNKPWDYDEFFYLTKVSDNPEENAEALPFYDLGKKINFTAQYGAKAPKVATKLCITAEDAEKYLKAREKAFPGLIERVKEWNKLCRERKYSTTMLGARRHLDGRVHYGSRNESELEAADRLSYSMRIQGSAAEMVKLVMGEMYRRGIFDNGEVIPCMQIHDELVLQIEDDKIPKWAPLLVEIMCMQYADMIIPLETEPESGKNFGSLKHLTLEEN